MDTSRFRNQDELVKDYLLRHGGAEKEVENDELFIPSASRFHTYAPEEILEVLMLILKSRPIITKVLWSLVDQTGELFFETQGVSKVIYPEITTLHTQPDAHKRVAEFLQNFVVDQNILAFEFATGDKVMKVVRGQREEGMTGRVFVSYLNPYI